MDINLNDLPLVIYAYKETVDNSRVMTVMQFDQESQPTVEAGP